MSGRKIPFASAFLVLCLCALSASAQSTSGQSRPEQGASSQSSTQGNAAQVSPESADLAITATVTAKELSFKVVPNPTVEFTGKPERETVWDAERDNLPRSVQPGVTYRNIGIRLKIVSRFADIERIVAEALGEIPATDSIPPKENHPAQQQNTPPASTSKPNGGSPQ